MDLSIFQFKRVTYFLILFFALENQISVCLQSLDTVNDSDLINLLQTEKYVIVLFSKKDCPIGEKWEKSLFSIKNELEDSLTQNVVKVVNSQIRKVYSPSKESAVVFFRHGIPLLYEELLSNEELLFSMVQNKEPIVKELTDENFEHLTQASSGATTGDWFIMFYSTDCAKCEGMDARWEAVGAKLKQRVNVARVNTKTTGVSSARRFGVYEVPEFIFFRLGKMYRYQIPKYDVNSFVSFTKDWYKNARSEKVSVPQSPFDNVTQMVVEFLQENPWVMKLGSICICVLLIVTASSKLLRKSEASSQKKDK